MLTVGRVGAGTGCKYLTEQVATGKDDFAPLSPAQALVYYSDVNAHGESPGRWLGRGLPTLALAGAVTASELENLIGLARHPHYDEQLQRRALELLNDLSLSVEQRRTALHEAEKNLYLGRGFGTYESASDRAERAVADLGDDADDASRDAVRAQVLADGDRQAVAAFELTFTPVKSVSVLAAMGGASMWQQVLDAHRAAVDSALGYVQDHASYSRAGVNGIRQIDTQGLVIAAFAHRMSRAQDPNIHTHAIVANRVLCADGKWRTVDGRAIYAASVGARAIYEHALEVELEQRLGVRFSTDERHTIREVHGIPLEVIELFSKRRAAITEAITDAGAMQHGDHSHDGREQISATGWRKLARRFTLSTRSAKTGGEASSDAITRWQREAREAGYDPAQLVAAATSSPRHELRPRIDQQIVAEAIVVLNQTRAVWTRHHAVLAVSRVLPPAPGVTFIDHQAHVEGLVHRLLAESVQVTPPDLLTVGPSLLRESDAQSVFTAHGDVLFAARSTVAAEQRILACLTDGDAPRIPAVQLAASVARVPLGDDQDAAVHDVITSGARISAIVGPAGSGKTYVQRAITAAWTHRVADPDANHHLARTPIPEHAAGYQQVLALAPSQIAASVLAESIGARAENVPKWLTEHRRQTKNAADAARSGKTYVPDPQWTLQPGQLVIIDEAGMVTTRELDAVLSAVRKADAKLLLVGDDHQLGAIGAGGMFATVADRTHAPVLTTVRRFHDEHGTLRAWECAASLGLRDRDLDAVAEYERRGRIHSGPLARMEDTIYRAWLNDHLRFQHAATHQPALDAASAVTDKVRLAGRDRAADKGRPVDVALLMADTEAAAAELSARARADLVRLGMVEQNGVPLADGNRAGIGDLVVTRLNERRLRATGSHADGIGFVANRDTWCVTDRGRDGSLTVVSVTSIAANGAPRQLHLPPSYVAANVQLAYAGTVHSAQGRTVTTARGLVTESTSAQALYVMMSRGRLSNDAYLVTDDPDREQHQHLPEQHHLAVLASILERDDQPTASVADVERDLYDNATSIARLRIIFADLSTGIRGSAYEQIITDHLGADTAQQAVTDPAWATLVRALGTAQLLGWDSRQLLIQALTQRELGSAADVAAVLHWRCATITGHWEAAMDPSGDDTARSPAVSWRDRATGIVNAARGDSLADLVSADGVDAIDALTQVAAAMDQRIDSLAQRLADQALAGQQGGYDNATIPSWLKALGPFPASGRAVLARRDAWLTQAGAVAQYQDAVGYEPPESSVAHAEAGQGGVDADPIGPRPASGDAEARELWRLARQALADAPLAATMRALSPGRLRGWVAEGVQAETYAQPTYVGHELRAVSLRARAQRTRVTGLRQQVTTAAGQVAGASRRRWRRHNDAIASLTRTHNRISSSLEHSEQSLHQMERDLRAVTGMHQTWQRWEQATRDVRVRARLAAQELGLRGIEPDDAVVSVDGTPPMAYPGSPNALAHQVKVAQFRVVSPETMLQQYSIQADAAQWFESNLNQRWAPAYLHERGLTETAAAAHVGYAPSRPGQWTLLADHLRRLGYQDTSIETAGLASRSSRGELIDRFRDRVILPILDAENRPIGFLGRKPAGDTNPDNPKYLNPTSTPLYDKSRVLYGLDAYAIAKLDHGARAIIVEGPMDRLAIQLAAPDLVPLATCGTALTDAHLDLLAEHTALDRIILGFDADPAGRNASLAAGRKLSARAVPAHLVETFTAIGGSDPADVLATYGVEHLADQLTDARQHGSLLDLLVDEQLDHYAWPEQGAVLRDLPIAAHAAYDATRFIADTIRGQLDARVIGEIEPGHIQRQLARVTDRTGVSQQELNAYLVAMTFPDDELGRLEPLPAVLSQRSAAEFGLSRDPDEAAVNDAHVMP